MKKNTLITLCALISTSLTSQAQTPSNAAESFSFISGGLQYTSLNQKVVSSVYSDFDSFHAKSADSLAGLSLRGSWSFTENVFVELRSDVTTREALTLMHSTFGMGYYQQVADNLTLFGMAGLAGVKMERDILNHDLNGLIKISREDNGLSGEFGARISLTDLWSIEPAIRVANCDETLHELRLGNIIQVSNHMSIELNALKRTIVDYEEVNYQIGARYSI